MHTISRLAISVLFLIILLLVLSYALPKYADWRLNEEESKPETAISELLETSACSPEAFAGLEGFNWVCSKDPMTGEEVVTEMPEGDLARILSQISIDDILTAYGPDEDTLIAPDMYYWCMLMRRDDCSRWVKTRKDVSEISQIINVVESFVLCLRHEASHMSLGEVEFIYPEAKKKMLDYCEESTGITVEISETNKAVDH